MKHVVLVALLLTSLSPILCAQEKPAAEVKNADDARVAALEARVRQLEEEVAILKRALLVSQPAVKPATPATTAPAAQDNNAARDGFMKLSEAGKAKFREAMQSDRERFMNMTREERAEWTRKLLEKLVAEDQPAAKPAP